MSVDVDFAAVGSPTPSAMEVRPPVMVAFLIAWSLAIGAELTGVARHLGHDAVLESGLPPAAGLGLFVVGWLVMVAAMMLPTIPAAGVPEGPGSAHHDGLGAFLGGFALVWAVVGMAALSLDMVLHRVVHAFPALDARPGLVAAGALGLAGAVQLMPATRRSMAARVPLGPHGVTGARTAFDAGQRHGRLCVRSDGPLMLVMFAAGGGLAWMAVLTTLMIGERSSRYGPHLAVATGVTFLAGAAVLALDLSWLPRFGPR